MAGAGYYEEAGYMESEGPGLQGPLMMVVILVGMGLAVPWYLSSAEPALSEAVQHVRVGVMLLPLLLLVALKLLSASSNSTYDNSNAAEATWSILSPSLEASHVHEAGGSPWGISIFLVIIVFMIWYQSGFQQSWHPIMRN